MAIEFILHGKNEFTLALVGSNFYTGSLPGDTYLGWQVSFYAPGDPSCSLQEY